MPTPFMPLNGVRLETTFTADAKTLLPCPFCNHLIPDIQANQLTLNPVVGTAEWIDCACPQGQGTSRFPVTISGCPCYARFRVKFVFANCYELDGVDYATMDARRIEREHQESAMHAAIIAAYLPDPEPEEPTEDPDEILIDEPLMVISDEPIDEERTLAQHDAEPKSTMDWLTDLAEMERDLNEQTVMTTPVKQPTPKAPAKPTHKAPTKKPITKR